MNLEATSLAADDEASELFVQRLYGEWTPENQRAFETRLERDLVFANAWKRVEEGWASLDRHAEAPEVMTYRADAIGEVRRANARRWFKASGAGGFKWKIAAAIAGVVLLGIAWQLSPYGYRFGEYRTDIGEQRIVELTDHSRITIDAATRLQVRFSDEARTVRLLEGQAQFSVAKDPGRPFKVLAGDRTVVAIGTVFTVEYVDRNIHVAMLEGKVLVGEGRAEGVSLSAGEELHIASNGKTLITPKADLEAATAWRQGKVIFRTEPLAKAVNRMNRYSRLQLEIDDASLAAKNISGVFEAGDTRGFVDALQRYLPVTAEYTSDDIVRLRAR